MSNVSKINVLVWLCVQAEACTFPDIALPGVDQGVANYFGKLLKIGHRTWVNNDLNSAGLVNLNKAQLLLALRALADAAQAPAGTPGAGMPLKYNRRRHALIEAIEVRWGCACHASQANGWGVPWCPINILPSGRSCLRVNMRGAFL